MFSVTFCYWMRIQVLFWLSCVPCLGCTLNSYHVDALCVACSWLVVCLLFALWCFLVIAV